MKAEYIIRKPEYYLNKIKAGKPMVFSKYGDRDWLHIVKNQNHDKNYNVNPPGMRKDIINVLTNPRKVKDPEDYIYATTYHICQGFVTNFINKNLSITNIKWHFGQVFHFLLESGRLFPVIEQLRKMKVIVVGPSILMPLEAKTFPYTHFIEVPTRNAYLKKETIKKRLLNIFYEGALISFSAGLLSQILMYELYPIIGSKCIMWDFGGIWNFMLGDFIRGAWRQKNKVHPDWIPSAIKANRGEIKEIKKEYRQGDINLMNEGVKKSKNGRYA